MSEPSSSEVTQLLKAWGDGDKEALDRLIPVVYREIHRLAHSYLRKEGSGRRLQTTELVNEAYMQLSQQTRVRWQSRAHFFGIAAQIMRRILAEQARRRKAQKRGLGVEPISLEVAPNLPAAPEVDVADLDEALKRLTLLDARQAQMVELRYFAGLTIQETAEVVGVSEATVKREWRSAIAWLHRELTRRPGDNYRESLGNPWDTCALVSGHHLDRAHTTRDHLTDSHFESEFLPYRHHAISEKLGAGGRRKTCSSLDEQLTFKRRDHRQPVLARTGLDPEASVWREVDNPEPVDDRVTAVVVLAARRRGRGKGIGGQRGTPHNWLAEKPFELVRAHRQKRLYLSPERRVIAASGVQMVRPGLLR